MSTKFCPKCDNVLLVKKKKDKSKNGGEKKKMLFCSSCGYEMPFDSEKDKAAYTLKERLAKSSRDKTLIVLGAVDDGTSITEEIREANEEYFNPDE
ncbi:MAG: hypothetical protein ACTSU9_11545 [Promethearchaeota archaeon]